jgi:uncharacterized protein (TIGR04255 family)
VVPILGQLEAVGAFRLERHQIAQVLCQVQFSPVLRLRQEDAVIPFQDAVRERYPEFRGEQGMSIILTPQGPITQQREAEKLWRFRNKDEGYSITLATNFVALETWRYADINDLCERLREALTLVEENYHPAKTTRVGLRFINEIRFNKNEIPDGVLSAFNPQLLGVLGAKEFAGAADEARASVELHDGDDHFTVRHGLERQGGTTVDPSLSEHQSLDKPFYLLDMDAFSEAEMMFSPDGIDERVRLYNDQVRSFFAWAVKEDFRRDVLGQKEEGS